MNIHHIGYLVKDIKKSEAQFMTLGFRMEYPKRKDPDRRVYIEFLVNGGYRVELIQPMDMVSEYYPLLKVYKNQPYHICYRTNDMDRTIHELTEKHFILVKAPERALCLENKAAAFLSGGGVELIELIEDL